MCLLQLMMKTILTTTATAALLSVSAQAAQIRIDISNNAPSGGVAITPVWVGLHDGGFNNFTAGAAADAGLESIAEDGMIATRSMSFLSTAGRVDGAIGAPSGPPPLQPGESGSIVLTVADDGSNSFLSYASMVLVSNDFFVGNGAARDISSVLNGGGPLTFNIGETVWDAGTEVNDFATSAANGLFGFTGGQSGPNEGAIEGGVITEVTGADPFGAFANLGNAGATFPEAFNFANYTNGIGTVTITAVPEPSSAVLAGIAALGMVVRRRR